MIQAARSLAINPQDPPMWETLSKSSKAVSDAIKKLVSAIKDLAPGKNDRAALITNDDLCANGSFSFLCEGQRECDEAIEKLTNNIRDLDQASLAAINQNLTPTKDIEIRQITDQMENASHQIEKRIPEVRESAKKEIEVLGHAINAMTSFFGPLTNSAINCASTMVNFKQQVGLNDIFL